MDTGLVERAAQDHAWMTGVDGDIDTLVRPDGTILQDGGHGTFVAGCVRVTAPEAKVHVVNAAQLLAKEDGIGAAFESDLADLVRKHLVADDDQPPLRVPDILVLNFAGTTQGGRPPVALAALYDSVIQHVKELLILSPAGNEGDRRKNWPASFAWVVSVGGLAANWRDRASWSNHGHNVDVYAPGDRLVNAFATGHYVCGWDPAPHEVRIFKGMALWSGTSFSTPLVAGLVASRMSTTGQSSRRAWESLFDLAERQAVPGVGPVLYPGQELA
jgi:subtilisin family serine protease